MEIDQEAIEDAADLMVRSRPSVFFTGAGVSVESGIPDFRSEGGLWDQYNAMEYATIEAFIMDPHKVWRMLRALEKLLDQAAPNAGHLALAKLEEIGLVAGIITQNIDNLHQEAGSKRVVDFHGNGRRLACIYCGERIDADEARSLSGGSDEPPTCRKCEKIIKPEVVFFGEAIPENALDESFDLCKLCGVMVIAGTSANVLPAAGLPSRAKSNGAALVEINLEETNLSQKVDVSIRGSWATVMPALSEAVQQRLESA